MATDNFPQFARLVADAFQTIAKHDPLVVGVDGDALYERYLSAFPEGTNPKFKERTEHDCSCCKSFIRHAGNVVCVDGSVILTIWDYAAMSAPAPYAEIATALRALVLDAHITDLFRVGQNETSFGAETTRSQDKESGRALTWRHFYTGNIPKALRVLMPDGVRGDFRTTVAVFKRGLEELSPDAVDMVLSLVDANNLYRGAEHRPAVAEFQRMQREYLALRERERDTYAWTAARGPAARFRNTVIGTLVQDLSVGDDVERAVAAFEAKVAPQNYKRTTAVITPGMVKKAMETIESLGLESALERRYARLEDVAVTNVLWVDSSVKSLMKGGLADALMQHAVAAAAGDNAADEERAEPILITGFLWDVLPKVTGMDLLFKGAHVGNLVSLTAPIHPEPKQLFRWHNDFAWSYGGNVTDSIKERVKRAGGRVEGAALRISLSWFNFDDLDLHVYEPNQKGYRAAMGNHIWFSSRHGWTGGQLDVDMNAGHGTARDAVENVAWTTPPPDGAYKVVVNNFAKRESVDVGFNIEIECAGKVTHFSYNKAVRSQQDIHVCTLHMKGGRIDRFEEGDSGITSSAISQEKWGLRTETYVKVNLVTLSPNYWGEEPVGNKHFLFMLEGAKNDEAARGIYNEFLHPRLEKHRKVFEVIGDKTKCPPADDQLSGLGFSSTKADDVVVRVRQGKRQRLFKIHVGP